MAGLSPVAAGGIVSVSYTILSRQAVGLWSSLWLSHPVNSGIVPFPFGFRHQSRRTSGSVLAHSPLHSAVWTFLSDVSVGARVRIPRCPI